MVFFKKKLLIEEVQSFYLMELKVEKLNFQLQKEKVSQSVNFFLGLEIICVEIDQNYS